MNWETDFIEPDSDAVRVIAREVLARAGDRTPAPAIEWIRSGSSTLVGLAGSTAIRISRTPRHASELVRAQQLVDALPTLPFAVPRSQTAAMEYLGVTGIGVQRVPGEARPPGPADPIELRSLLDSIHSIDPAPLRHLLAPARAFCGGTQWYQVLTEQAVPHLPTASRSQALALVDALASLPDVERVVNHGDLAGSNLLWEGGHVSGVLDWDLTSWEDPAEDVASLAGWHGWDLAPSLADPDTIARARSFHRVFPLMILGFNLVNHRPAGEVARAVERVIDHLDRNT